MGATHPAVLRQNGEAYRTSLEREAEQLGVREHVVFRDQYVTTEELCSYLQAADVFVSPYLNEAQVTSGALSYAMGAGAAVRLDALLARARSSSPTGAGACFPSATAPRLARDDLRRCSTIPRSSRACAARGYEYTRAFTWPRVGAQYLQLGETLARPAPARGVAATQPRASSLPELRLDHLLRLTDDTGIIQHATFSVPARESGYCVDDNARALMVALHAEAPERLGGHQAARLDVPRLSSRRADARGPVPKLHELRPRRSRHARTARSPRTARAARCGRWARPLTSRATRGSACWRGRCSSAACPTRPSSVPAERR